MATLAEISRLVTSSLDPQTVLDATAQATARLLGISQAIVWLYDPSADALRMAAVMPAHEIRSDVALPVDNTIGGAALRSRRPIVAPRVREHPLWRDVLGRTNPLASAMFVPILHQENPIGVIAALSADERTFTDEDVQLLQTLAAQVAIAIENARALEREQQRRQQLEAIRDVTAEITRELDLGTVLLLAIRRAADLVGAASGVIFLWDEESQLLLPRTWHHLGEWVNQVHLKLGEGALGTAAERREGLIVNQYRSSPYGRPIVLERSDVTAILAEPIMYQERLIGVLAVNHHGSDREFSEQDQQLLRLFASQAAIAIENARLLQRAATADTLAELASLRSDFLRTVYHELRTPLTVIIGYANLLDRRAGELSVEQLRQFAARIDSGARSMERLVEDLLDARDMEQGTLRIHPRQLAISELLKNLIEGFRRQPGGRRIRAEVVPELEAYADPDRLTQIVNNLLANALHYAQDGPIVLRATRRDDWVRVSVSDRGPGIPSDEQARVWERSYRGSSAVSADDRGRGLGLAIVRDLVELHGGRVGLSSSPGRGARFWFTLPVKA